MPNIDKKWVVKQLADSNIPVRVGNVVIELVESWNSTKVGSPETEKKIIEIFSKLSLGIPIHIQTQEDEVWIPARPGAIKVGDEVLVRPDAYEGELATIHNGRRGRVVAIRYGDIIVNSTDNKEPVLVGTHYPPTYLQKLVK